MGKTVTKVVSEVDRIKRREMVADLYFKGYLRPAIAERLKKEGMEVSTRTISKDLQLIKKQLRTKSIATLEYRKAKYLRALDQVRSDAWALRERFGKEPSACFASHRVVISALDLQAKIDGVITEKISVAPGRIEELQKELIGIEKEAKAKGRVAQIAEQGSEATHISENRV